MASDRFTALGLELALQFYY